MLSWLAANYPSLIAGAVVIVLVIICLRNILPRKGKKPAACAGCSGSCAGCAGCASRRKKV